MNRLHRLTKRLIDVTVAGAGIIVLSPLLGTLSVVVVTKYGWPPVFTQKRPGRGGRLFTLFKFRTMTNERDLNGALLPDAERLSKFGAWLRATSLDELPELINVLRGEMSLVGPRPLLVQYLERYSAEQLRRHDVKPGITGWAQINGRNALSWEQKFALDIWYVDHASVWLDLRILALTALTVFRREGISAEGAATMPEFMGTQTQSTEAAT